MILQARSSRTFKTRPVLKAQQCVLNKSQEKVHGFSLEQYQAAHVLMIGVGGIGTHVTEGLTRKGVGTLTMLDDDVVELPNLTRQLFSREDTSKNKALRRGRRLAGEGLFPCTIHCHPFRFQEQDKYRLEPARIALTVCGVDNNRTRADATHFGITHSVPVIHAAVSRDGNQAYCAVQEPGEACWGCMFPHLVNDESYPCDLPGVIDVLQVVAGLVVYAADSLICGRYREWNLKEIFLDGSIPDRSRSIERRENCELCGSHSEAVETA